jgi:hypothetical protein
MKYTKWRVLATERWLIVLMAVVSLCPAVAFAKPPAPESDHPGSAGLKTTVGESDTKTGKPLTEEEDINKLFLRHMSVLLDRRQIELEVGLSYMYSRLYDPTQNQLTYSRLGQLSLALSFGLASFIQGAVSAPLVFHQEHGYRYTDSREEVSQGLRSGNVTTALSVQILRATGPWPDIMLFSDLSIPLSSTSANTGTQIGKVYWGFWSADVGLNIIKIVDPVILVAGASYGHPFERTSAGQHMQIGEFWGYIVGAGFAVNGKVSLSTTFRGGWQGPTHQDGKRIVDTEAEPMSLGMTVIYAASRSWYVSPSLAFPLNSDGGTVVLTFPVAHRF